ncbi:MAG: hypothetical protein LBR11_12285 [Deltaproteobacteria bacterium]|jgi:hypothetical protein|nr:hypothetical protein [Deltaproteobacteria bacterium]
MPRKNHQFDTPEPMYRNPDGKLVRASEALDNPSVKAAYLDWKRERAKWRGSEINDPDLSPTSEDLELSNEELSSKSLKRFRDPEKAIIAKKVQVLAGYGMPVEQIALILEITVPQLVKKYSSDIYRGMALTNAIVVQRLFQKALSGDTQCLIFWAKCRLGWQEKQTIDHTSSDRSMSPAPNLSLNGSDLQKLEELCDKAWRDEGRPGATQEPAQEKTGRLLS